MVVEKRGPYLQHNVFTIKIDHKSLTFLEGHQLHSPLQRKSMSRLMGLQFHIVYRHGKHNVVVDALSRVGHMMVVQVVSEIKPLRVQEVLISYMTDGWLHSY